MLKFKTEQGDYTTPRKGDYVLASDIKDEAMHNQVREAFDKNNDIEFLYGKYGAFQTTIQNDKAKRRIIPTQQTLFEAACEAEDGARFKCHGYDGEFVRTNVSDLVWVREGFQINGAPFRAMTSTDFEQLPSGPKKRDVAMIPVGDVVVPNDAWEDCVVTFDLIGRLMQWEGAQIGKPGWVMVKNNERWFADRTANDIYTVTFETEEQCLAAHKAEFPEMFE